MSAALQAELLAMVENDSRIRSELVASGELFDGYNAEMAAVHNRNADRLERIVDEFGWPTARMVGDDGAEAAWLILQHAIARPALQRKCLPILQAAADAGDVPALQVAYLDDRIRFFEGRPQRYGTQFDWDEQGKMSPAALEDPEQVDEYRRSVGLRPLAEKTTEMRQRAAAEGARAPRDYRARRKDAEAWARSVGWR